MYDCESYFVVILPRCQTRPLEDRRGGKRIYSALSLDRIGSFSRRRWEALGSVVLESVSRTGSMYRVVIQACYGFVEGWAKSGAVVYCPTLNGRDNEFGARRERRPDKKEDSDK